MTCTFGGGGSVVNPSSEAANSAGRPVTTATARIDAASRRNASGASGCGRAAAGSGTIGASVPSKSTPTRARCGCATIARNPSTPAAVAGTGSGTPRTLPAVRRPVRGEHEGEVGGRDAAWRRKNLGDRLVLVGELLRRGKLVGRVEDRGRRNRVRIVAGLGDGPPAGGQGLRSAGRQAADVGVVENVDRRPCSGGGRTWRGRCRSRRCRSRRCRRRYRGVRRTGRRAERRRVRRRRDLIVGSVGLATHMQRGDNPARSQDHYEQRNKQLQTTTTTRAPMATGRASLWFRHGVTFPKPARVRP